MTSYLSEGRRLRALQRKRTKDVFIYLFTCLPDNLSVSQKREGIGSCNNGAREVPP